MLSNLQKILNGFEYEVFYIRNYVLLCQQLQHLMDLMGWKWYIWAGKNLFWTSLTAAKGPRIFAFASRIVFTYFYLVQS